MYENIINGPSQYFLIAGLWLEWLKTYNEEEASAPTMCYTQVADVHENSMCDR